MVDSDLEVMTKSELIREEGRIHNLMEKLELRDSQIKELIHRKFPTEMELQLGKVHSGEITREEFFQWVLLREKKLHVQAYGVVLNRQESD